MAQDKGLLFLTRKELSVLFAALDLLKNYRLDHGMDIRMIEQLMGRILDVPVYHGTEG